MRRIARFFIFIIATIAITTGVSFAQGETKLAGGYQATADPSPWEKELESGLWHLERDAPGGRWQMVMAVVNEKIHFTIRIPCESEGDSVYTWKEGMTLAHGANCQGRKAAMGVRHLKEWIHPLPREVQGVTKTNHSIQGRKL